MTIKELDGEGIVLLTDSKDVKEILRYVGYRDEEFDGLILSETEGDYDFIYGFFGIPFDWKEVVKVL